MDAPADDRGRLAPPIARTAPLSTPRLLLLLSRALAVACLLAGAPSLAAESVTLQLNGKHSFRFAGYYVAKVLGYYADEGLDVNIVEAETEDLPVDAVVSGKAAFGVGSSRLLVSHGQAKPVVALAAIFQQTEPGSVFYGDVLFTAEREIRRREKAVVAFREASLRGWRWAMENREKAVDIVLRTYGGDRKREDFLQEAGVVAAQIRPDLVEVGHMNPTRWRKIAEAYIDQKLLPPTVSLEGFLYRPDARADLERVYVLLAVALAALALAGGMVIYVQRINARLRQALAESEKAHAARVASEERMRLLGDHASDVIWTRDLDGRFTYVSPSVVKLRGFSVEDAMAQSLDEAFAPPSAAAMKEGIADILAKAAAGEAEPEFRSELEQFCADGATVWVETTVTAMRGRDGRLAGVVGVTRDISERKRTEAHIRELSLHDALTGLPNRTLFSDRLGRALSAAYREARRVGVMFIDLDKFKPVNDNFGHAVGDLLLKEVAVRMRANVRDSDTVARIGGDEFVVLLRTVEGAREARSVAEKIRLAIDEPFEVAGRRLEISCSIGIAVYPDHGKDELELSKNADAAMYWAKAHGRDSVQLYDAGLQHPA
jgi:diguanylate cyclase (GGDEF)-like protein/PAS domain S-box-containing protein